MCCSNCAISVRSWSVGLTYLHHATSLFLFNTVYAQGIANDELQLVDPHNPFRKGHRGTPLPSNTDNESKESKAAVAKAPKSRIWHAKFRGVPAIAKEACPGYETPSRYELRSLTKKVELLQSVEHKNVLGVLGLVTAHVPPLTHLDNDDDEAKDASAAREPGDLMSPDDESPKRRNSLVANDKANNNDKQRGEQVSVVVLELFEHGYALDASTYESESFTTETFSVIGLGVVSGLAGMHAALVAHGNLCPANVLVDLSRDGEVKRLQLASLHSALTMPSLVALNLATFLIKVLAVLVDFFVPVWFIISNLLRVQVLKVQLASFALSNKRGALVDNPAFVAPEISSAAEDRKVCRTHSLNLTIRIHYLCNVTCLVVISLSYLLCFELIKLW